MTPHETAAALSEAQKRAVRNASRNRPKSWPTLCRHAKLRRGAMTWWGFADLFERAGLTITRRTKYVLTPLGQQVRAILEQRHD